MKHIYSLPILPMIVISCLVCPLVVHAELGDVLQSFPTPGPNPSDLAWVDGLLYMSNMAPVEERTIFCINPEDGSVIGEIDYGGTVPQGLAWDGVNLWESDISTLSIYKLDPTNGAIRGFISAPRGNSQPLGLGWDGFSLWVADSRSPEMIFQMDTTGVLLDSFPAPGSSPYGLTWANGFIWVSDNNMSAIAWIYKMDAFTGARIDSFACPGNGGSPNGITYDGQDLWVAVNSTDTIYRVDDGINGANEPPGAFSLLSPGDEDTVRTRVISFNWEEAVDPDPGEEVTYTLMLLDAEGATILDSLQNLSASNADWDIAEGEYQWQVVAYDGHNHATVSSETWTLYHWLNTVLPCPFDLLLPAHQAILNPETDLEFAWATSSDDDPEAEVTYTFCGICDEAEPLVGDLADTSLAADPFDLFELPAYPWEQDISATWWVLAISQGDTVSSVDTFEVVFHQPESVRESSDISVPGQFRILALYPNPCNAHVDIRYILPEAGGVTIRLHDVIGREVRPVVRLHCSEGIHHWLLDGHELASGIYILSLHWNTQHIQRKVCFVQ